VLTAGNRCVWSARFGAAFEVAVGLSTGQVGDATARLTPQRPLVDFATDWMETHRPKV
jgi:aminoglycoside 3-N-acetyltransferase